MVELLLQSRDLVLDRPRQGFERFGVPVVLVVGRRRGGVGKLLAQRFQVLPQQSESGGGLFVGGLERLDLLVLGLELGGKLAALGIGQIALGGAGVEILV